MQNPTERRKTKVILTSFRPTRLFKRKPTQDFRLRVNCIPLDRFYCNMSQVFKIFSLIIDSILYIWVWFKLLLYTQIIKYYIFFLHVLPLGWNVYLYSHFTFKNIALNWENIVAKHYLDLKEHVCYNSGSGMLCYVIRGFELTSSGVGIRRYLWSWQMVDS